MRKHPNLPARVVLRLLFALLLFIASIGASAAAGGLDLTFGTQGTYTPPPECCGTKSYSAIIVQPDGRILMGGIAQNASEWDTVLVRLNADGSLDGSLGSGGVARFRPSASSSGDIRSIVTQPDGRIVVAGTQYAPTGFSTFTDPNIQHGFIARFTSAGALDVSFGVNGVATVGPLVDGSPRTVVRRLLLQPDGKIVLVGTAGLHSGDTDMFAARFTADGTVDSSFGTNGATLSGLVSRDEGYDGALGSDGTIIVVGSAMASNATFGAAMRLLSNGQDDLSFGNNGIQAPLANSASDMRSVAIQGDGKYLLGGQVDNAPASMRLLQSGAIDSSYANSGVRTYSTSFQYVTRVAFSTGAYAMILLEDSNAFLEVVRVDSDGLQDPAWTPKVFASAGGRDVRVGDLAAANGTVLLSTSYGASRFTSSGASDPSFGVSGLATANPGLVVPTGELLSIALATDGSIYLVRLRGGGQGGVVSKLTPYGQDDPSFGSSGKVVVTFSDVSLSAVAYKSDGRLLIGYFDGGVYQLNPDGSVDQAFTPPQLGRVLYIVPYSDGRFIAGAEHSYARFLANGSIDPAFNSGQPNNPADPGVGTLAVLGSGGYLIIVADPSGVFIEKHDVSGAPDLSFGTSGRSPRVIVGNSGRTFATGMATQPDGKIVIAGYGIGPGSIPFIARFRSDGSLDPAFGSNGVQQFTFANPPTVSGMAIQGDGKIVVVGTESTYVPGAGTFYRAFVFRVNPDGSVNTSFGGGGSQYIDTSSGGEFGNVVALQPNGEIIVAGSASHIPSVWRLFGSDTGPGSVSAALVSSYYRTILGREPDSGGSAFWQSELARVTSLGASASETFYVLATTFFQSPEYLQKNTSNSQFVTDLYHTFFTREPDSGGMSFWLTQVSSGRPRDAVLNEFLFSPEFSSYMTSLFGPSNASRPEVSIVMDFYRGFLHRLPDSDGMNFWVGQMRSAQCAGTVTSTANQISFNFLNSQEYANRMAAQSSSAAQNAAYVLDLYSAFMRRGADIDGFNFYTNQLGSGAQSYEQARQAFVNSQEFQQRVNAVQSPACNS